MTHRSPARFLAPLALVAAVVTVYLVARPELNRSESRSSSQTTSASSSTSAKATAARRKRTTTTASTTREATRKTYTVKPGDVLSTISDTTGVSVADLLDYNDVDADSLRVGQKLKLAP